MSSLKTALRIPSGSWGYIDSIFDNSSFEKRIIDDIREEVSMILNLGVRSCSGVLDFNTLLFVSNNINIYKLECEQYTQFNHIFIAFENGKYTYQSYNRTREIIYQGELPRVSLFHKNTIDNENTKIVLNMLFSMCKKWKYEYTPPDSRGREYHGEQYMKNIKNFMTAIEQMLKRENREERIDKMIDLQKAFAHGGSMIEIPKYKFDTNIIDMKKELAIMTIDNDHMIERDTVLHKQSMNTMKKKKVRLMEKLNTIDTECMTELTHKTTLDKKLNEEEEKKKTMINKRTEQENVIDTLSKRQIDIEKKKYENEKRIKEMRKSIEEEENKLKQKNIEMIKKKAKLKIITDRHICVEERYKKAIFDKTGLTINDIVNPTVNI